MNKPINFKELIVKLNQKVLPESVEREFLKLGQSAFNYLFKAVSENQLTERQTVNALHILFNLTREYCYGEQNRLLKLTLQTITDNRKLIRVEASIIVIRLAELGKKFPALCISQDMIMNVLEPVQPELPEPAYSYVEKYLATQKYEIFKVEIERFTEIPRQQNSGMFPLKNTFPRLFTIY